MRNPFDDPKVLSMILREQESTRLTRGAANILAEKRAGLTGIAADILAEKRVGITGVPAQILAEKKVGLTGAASGILAERKVGLTGAAAGVLAEKKVGLTGVAAEILDEKRAAPGVAAEILAEKRVGISMTTPERLAVRNAGMGVQMSNALAAASLANTSLSEMTKRAGVIFDRNTLLNGISNDWLREMGTVRRETLAATTGAAFKSHLINTAGISIRAEAALASLSSDRLGPVSISGAAKKALTGTFVDFSHSYQTLWKSLESSPASMLSFSPALSRLPAVEYYNGAILATRLVGEEDEDDRETQVGITLETQEVLNEFLAQLNPKLVAMRDGARQALNSKNPDRVRHFSASLRELFTQVMHELAPDKRIKAWSTSEKHYHNGRPTRKARLMYICRRINQQPLETFVEKDIDAVLEFLNLFQQSTHGVDVQYTAEQLRALETRMDGALRFLFEISRSE